MIIFKYNQKKMNIYLETLFKKYKISDKDRYEILQIYTFLPEEKKQNLINNFEIVVYKIQKIEKTLELEKEILIWDSVERVRQAVLQNRKKTIDEQIKKQIDLLKGEI